MKRKFILFPFCGVAIAALAVVARPEATLSQELKISGALVKLIDQLDVPAQEAGAIVLLDVQEGSRVKSGTVLARIDDSQARFALDRANVERQIADHAAASDVAVRSAQRALATALSELKRSEEARQKLRESVTETEMEKLRLAADQAKLAVEKAEQERAVAQLQKDLKRVEADFATRNVTRHEATAPFPGVVVQVHRHLGDWVQPGDKILRLIRLDRLRVEGFLESASAIPGLEGRHVTFAVDLPGKPGALFHGKLTFVSPEIDPFNHSVRVLAEIENPAGALQPGLRGTLTIGGSTARTGGK